MYSSISIHIFLESAAWVSRWWKNLAALSKTIFPVLGRKPTVSSTVFFAASAAERGGAAQWVETVWNRRVHFLKTRPYTRLPLSRAVGQGQYWFGQGDKHPWNTRIWTFLPSNSSKMQKKQSVTDQRTDHSTRWLIRCVACDKKSHKIIKSRFRVPMPIYCHWAPSSSISSSLQQSNNFYSHECLL